MEKAVSAAEHPQGHPQGFRAGGVRRQAPSSQEPLLRAALNSAQPGLIVLDNACAVRFLSHTASELFGVTLGRNAAPPVMRLLGQSPWLDPIDLQALNILFEGAQLGEQRETLICLTGQRQTQIISVTIRRAGKAGWVASLQDVTQNQREQQWLLEHAATDPVTGLWNRQHFMLMLRDRLENSENGFAAVLLLDLSRSTPVADMIGTPVGDTLLRLVAARLVNMLRDNDVLARFTSDEFAILLNTVPNRTAIAALAERLTHAIERPFVVEGNTISIGMHAGAACTPEDGETPESLIAHAGLALSAARAEARGLLRFYEPTLDAQARRRRALETDLRAALPNHEFVLHYQPQIDLQNSRIIGFEALLRWRSPTRGMVPPGEFIPITEQLGLINAVGTWVLRAACTAATSWPASLTVAVNASPLQMEAGGFAETVEKILAETGLPGERLEIEITENLLLRDNSVVASTIEALRRMGVRLALDDFGTGYASLAQLSRFRFDKIKIDRSFIASPAGSRSHDAIMRAITSLGNSLGIATTAEGVETDDQLRRCRDTGCTSVQGFLFSRPIPETEIPAMLHRFAASAPPPEEVALEPATEAA